MAINARQSTNRQFKSSISNRQSQSPIVNSESTIVIVHLNRQSAVGSRQSAVGSRQSAVGSRQSRSSIVNRQFRPSNRQSAVGNQNRQSSLVNSDRQIGNRQSAIQIANRQSSFKSSICNLQSAVVILPLCTRGSGLNRQLSSPHPVPRVSATGSPSGAIASSRAMRRTSQASDCRCAAALGAARAQLRAVIRNLRRSPGVIPVRDSDAGRIQRHNVNLALPHPPPS
jgi:hypothetical protein